MKYILAFLSLSSWIVLIACKQCSDFCKQTYPLHTFPKERLFYSCIRGCRLGRINQLSGNLRTSEAAINLCKTDCKVAYDNGEDVSACQMGCKEQDILPTPAGLLQVEMEKASLYVPVVHHIIVQPVRIFRHYCSGVMSNVVTFVALRTAFIVEDSGKDSITVSVESNPFVSVDIERDESARQLDGRRERKEGDASYYDRLYYHGSRWIDCVAAKAHLPPWLLSFALLLCFFTAIWLCCTTFFGLEIQDEKRYTFERVIDAHSLDSEKCPLFTLDQYEAPPLPTKTQLANVA